MIRSVNEASVSPPLSIGVSTLGLGRPAGMPTATFAASTREAPRPTADAAFAGRGGGFGGANGAQVRAPLPESGTVTAGAGRTAGITASGRDRSDAVSKAATEFEAMAIAQFLQQAFATVDPSSGPFGGGAAEAAWRPMLVDQIGQAIARAGGLGLAAPVRDEMLRSQAAVAHHETTAGDRWA